MIILLKLFQDLIKHTPEDHPDYSVLKKALRLSEENLKMYNTQSLAVRSGNVSAFYCLFVSVLGF